MDMIESEYVKSIVRKIVEDKRSKNITPDRALLGEIDKGSMRRYLELFAPAL